jgi:hypothetical protein
MYYFGAGICFGYKMLLLLLHWNLMSNGTNVLMFQGQVGLLSVARIDSLVTVLVISVALMTAEIITE